MKIKRVLLGTASVVVGLPLAVLLTAMVWIAALDRSTGTIVSSGDTREYLLHVPSSYDPTKPTPLVISLHARATWPAHQMNLSAWTRQARLTRGSSHRPGTSSRSMASSWPTRACSPRSPLRRVTSGWSSSPPGSVEARAAVDRDLSWLWHVGTELPNRAMTP